MIKNIPVPTKDEHGKYPAVTFPGGYTIAYYAADWGLLCAPCANGENGSDCQRTDLDPTCSCDDQWRVIAADIRWEGPSEPCSHCGADMPTEYGEVE